jgi:hypothetical protein
MLAEITRKRDHVVDHSNCEEGQLTGALTGKSGEAKTPERTVISSSEREAWSLYNV